MPWQRINKADLNEWNEKLKQTDATFYQYPYFVDTEYASVFSKPIFLTYKENNDVVAYVAIVVIGFSFLKFGIVEEGPIILNKNINPEILLTELKNFAFANNYIHLQIRPNDIRFENLLKRDKDFQYELFFPFHQKEEYNWNIYNQPEHKLLAGFKIQGRRKIVLAGRVPYDFSKLPNEDELKVIHKIFKNAAREKNYKQRPFRVFKEMYLQGKKHNLCDIYVAYLNDKIVNAVFIVKDAESFYHLSSALVFDGFHVNESPPAKLHFFIMKDCFYNENKSVYNISYGGSENLIRFKELFNPTEVEKRPYHTFIIHPKRLSFFQKMSPKLIPSVRNVLKKIGEIRYLNS